MTTPGIKLIAEGDIAIRPGYAVVEGQLKKFFTANVGGFEVVVKKLGGESVRWFKTKEEALENAEWLRNECQRQVEEARQ